MAEPGFRSFWKAKKMEVDLTSWGKIFQRAGAPCRKGSFPAETIWPMGLQHGPSSRMSEVDWSYWGEKCSMDPLHKRASNSNTLYWTWKQSGKQCRWHDSWCYILFSQKIPCSSLLQVGTERSRAWQCIHFVFNTLQSNALEKEARELNLCPISCSTNRPCRCCRDLYGRWVERQGMLSWS